MKYYVTADPHGFYTELHKVLDEKVFFTDIEPHKLIICGDLFDRGQEALKMQKFVLDLMDKDQVILVRGNHEDLAMDLVNNWVLQRHMQHHYLNKTFNTVSQLVNRSEYDIQIDISIGDLFAKTPYITKIIPAMINYFETDHYIFVHGWIPCVAQNNIPKIMDNWREADENDWKSARWTNGMDAAHLNLIEENKTIVCGHYHTSYGHFHFGNSSEEFGIHADFSPYYAKGIIAIDACTAYSGKINCIVIED